MTLIATMWLAGVVLGVALRVVRGAFRPLVPNERR